VAIPALHGLLHAAHDGDDLVHVDGGFRDVVLEQLVALDDLGRAGGQKIAVETLDAEAAVFLLLGQDEHLLPHPATRAAESEIVRGFRGKDASHAFGFGVGVVRHFGLAGSPGSRYGFTADATEPPIREARRKSLC